MKLTDTEVRYVANLANLNLTEDEIAQMVTDLGGILAHMDRLAEINTDGVEPMSQVLFEAGDTSSLRPDQPMPSLSNTDALANAPLAGQGYFKVPKVIERS